MKKYRIALYIRLSLEDAKTDSMSISSQRTFHGYSNPEYVLQSLLTSRGVGSFSQNMV